MTTPSDPTIRLPSLDLESEKSLLALVEEALDQAPTDQTGWLEAQCPPVLLKKALRMLSAAQEVSGDFTITLFQTDLYRLESPLIGTRIGAWQLTELLGEGGMGQVYLADRVDGTFSQTVAIKVIRAAAMNAQAIAQFESERQILSDLTHPNIAQLLDGGTTADGAPFVAMEYIDGLPFDRYIERHQPTLPQRLRLFQKVCAAVAHAHRSLVIHRDIKPSNILVSLDGEPKLLDFGIAKSLGVTQSERAETVSMLLTPSYASPEQVMGEVLTTATDIYSLGVVLYQCLTGQRPFNTEKLSPARYEQVITEQRPDAPSVRLRSLRDSRADKVAGDLDAMALCALAKDPDRRYSSVDAFSEDISRYLEGFPVLAQDDSLGYRLRKFVSRRRWLVLAGSAVAIVLTTALFVTLSQYQIAVAERERADDRFDQARTLSKAVMFDVYDAMSLVQGTLPARQALAEVGADYLDELATDPYAPDEILLDLGVQYARLSDLYGGIGISNLGETKRSRELLLKARVALAELLERRPNNTEAARQMMWIKRLLTNQFLHYDMDTSAALAEARSGLALADAHTKQQAVVNWRFQDMRWDLRGDLLKVLGWDNQQQLALVELDRYLIELKKPELVQNLRRHAGKVAYFQGLRGEIHADTDRAELAIPDFQKTLAYYRKRDIEQPDNNQTMTQVIRFELSLANIFLRQSDWQAALTHARTGEAIAQRLVSMDPLDSGAQRNHMGLVQVLAQALAGAGLLEEGQRRIVAALATYERLRSEDPENMSLVRDHSNALKDAGDVFGSADLFDTACDYYTKSTALWAYLDSAGELTAFDREKGLGGAEQALSTYCSS